jgi:hypothetical protein
MISCKALEMQAALLALQQLHQAAMAVCTVTWWCCQHTDEHCMWSFITLHHHTHMHSLLLRSMLCLQAQHSSAEVPARGQQSSTHRSSSARSSGAQGDGATAWPCRCSSSSSSYGEQCNSSSKQQTTVGESSTTGKLDAAAEAAAVAGAAMTSTAGSSAGAAGSRPLCGLRCCRQQKQ